MVKDRLENRRHLRFDHLADVGEVFDGGFSQLLLGIFLLKALQSELGEFLESFFGELVSTGDGSQHTTGDQGLASDGLFLDRLSLDNLEESLQDLVHVG